MTVTFPRTDIISGMKIRDGSLKAMFRNEYSRSANGQTRVKNMGPMLWAARYQTVPMYRNPAMELEADLLSLQDGIHLFEGYDPRRPDPKAATDADDLTGVTVGSVAANRTSLALSGLPANFDISKGDYISVNDGANLHLLQALEGKQASGTGNTSQIVVLGGVHPSVSAGQAVTLRNPSARFIIDAGSLSVNFMDTLFSTVSFTATQYFE